MTAVSLASSLQFRFALDVLNLESPGVLSYLESPPHLSSSWQRFLLPTLIFGSDKETKCPLGFFKSLLFQTWSTRVCSWTIFEGTKLPVVNTWDLIVSSIAQIGAEQAGFSKCQK